MEELSENAGETIHTKERGDVLQQVRTKEAGYGDMPEVPAADTARGGRSRETMQGIRGEEAKLTKKEDNEGENSEKVTAICVCCFAVDLMLIYRNIRRKL